MWILCTKKRYFKKIVVQRMFEFIWRGNCHSPHLRFLLITHLHGDVICLRSSITAQTSYTYVHVYTCIFVYSEKKILHFNTYFSFLHFFNISQNKKESHYSERFSCKILPNQIKSIALYHLSVWHQRFVGVICDYKRAGIAQSM